MNVRGYQRLRLWALKLDQLNRKEWSRLALREIAHLQRDLLAPVVTAASTSKLTVWQ